MTIGVDEDDIEVALLKIFEQLERILVEDRNVVVFTCAAEVGVGDVVRSLSGSIVQILPIGGCASAIQSVE